MHRISLVAKKANPVTVQNALLTTSDVDLALALYDVPDQERQVILEAAGPTKALRVHQELERLTRVKVKGKDLLTFQERFLQKIRGQNVGPTKRYFRPNIE
ncbi:MAG: hypothetical protein GW949_01455 [Spirochaetales bacterium]|nr:hypothetical protein [Spirochaetales bacterium]